MIQKSELSIIGCRITKNNVFSNVDNKWEIEKYQNLF